MSEAPEHLVKSYDQELKRLRNMMTQMGGIVETQVALAADAIMHRDAGAATRAVEEDPKVDALEREVETFVIRLLALRQPVAGDLRQIVAALKITGDLERIGDYAANVAKRSIVLAQFSLPYSLAGLAHMARMVQGQLKSIIDALGDNDADKAMEVWRSDQVVDDIYNAIFRELITYMMEDPRNITPCTHLLFIAKNLERIGDHATNVAENLYYAVKGESLPDARPKGDTSAYAVVRPPRVTEADMPDGISSLSKPLVLVVEDEAALATMLRYNLEKQGFRVEEAADGQEALTRIAETQPDLVLLDWMLPQMSGLEVCRQIRRRSATRDLPVIMVTARTEDQDAVRGLNTGADDYITKPFSMDALLARMRALLRRSNALPVKGQLAFHDITMDLAAHRVQRNGRPIHLGPTEFRLLEFFMQHPRRVFSREELLDAVWGPDIHVEPRTVDVHIRRLRKSINANGELDIVRTVRAAGYALDTEPV